jgi:hypothetical protein
MKWLLAAVLALWAGAAAAAPIRVMILDGASGGTYHDWKLTTQIMKRELEEAGLFDVTVVSAPPADGDFSNFHPDFSRYQVVLSNYDAQDWPAPLKAAFETYMKNGGGLVVVHGADNAFPDWAAFNEMALAGGASATQPPDPDGISRTASSHPMLRRGRLDCTAAASRSASRCAPPSIPSCGACRPHGCMRPMSFTPACGALEKT